MLQIETHLSLVNTLTYKNKYNFISSRSMPQLSKHYKCTIVETLMRQAYAEYTHQIMVTSTGTDAHRRGSIASVPI